MSNGKLHSRMPPSSAKRIINCPGSVGLYEKFGGHDNTHQEAADLGTLAHHAGFVTLSEKPNAFYYTRHKLPPDKEYPGLDQIITEEMAEHVQGYADYVTNLYNKTLKQTYGVQYIDKNLMRKPEEKYFLTEYHLEKRVGAYELHPDAHGTPDVILGTHFGDLHVIDFKYGVAPVSPENNPQLLCYAGYARITYGLSVRRVYLHIYQPRINRRLPYKVWATNGHYLNTFMKSWIKQMYHADTYPEEFKENKGCFFCPVKNTTCPVQLEKSTDKASEIFGEYLDETDLTFLKGVI